jgi:hypothetical protein
MNDFVNPERCTPMLIEENKAITKKRKTRWRNVNAGFTMGQLIMSIGGCLFLTVAILSIPKMIRDMRLSQSENVDLVNSIGLPIFLFALSCLCWLALWFNWYGGEKKNNPIHKKRNRTKNSRSS